MMSFFLLVFFYFFFETIYSTHVPSVRNCSNVTLSHLRANRRLALHQLKSETILILIKTIRKCILQLRARQGTI